MKVIAPYIAAIILACIVGFPAAIMIKSGFERGTQVLQDAVEGRMPR